MVTFCPKKVGRGQPDVAGTVRHEANHRIPGAGGSRRGCSSRRRGWLRRPSPTSPAGCRRRQAPAGRARRGRRRPLRAATPWGCSGWRGSRRRRDRAEAPRGCAPTIFVHNAHTGPVESASTVGQAAALTLKSTCSGPAPGPACSVVTEDSTSPCKVETPVALVGASISNAVPSRSVAASSER